MTRRPEDPERPWDARAPGPTGLSEDLQLPPYLMQDQPTRGRNERPEPALGRCPVPPRDIALVTGSVVAGAIGTQLVIRGYVGLLQDQAVRVRLGSALAVMIASAFAVGILPSIARLCSPRRWTRSVTVAAVVALGAALLAHLRLHTPVMWLSPAAVFAGGVAVVLAAAASYYLLAVWPVRTGGPADPDPPGAAPWGRSPRASGPCGLWWAVLAYPLCAIALCALLAASLA